MKEATLIFPHQLFKNHPALREGRTVYFVESAHFFTRYQFHKQKIAFHKASMDEYGKFLRKKGYHVTLIELHDDLWPRLKKEGIAELHCAELYDHVLEESVTHEAQKAGITLRFYESPYFMTSNERFEEYFSTKKHFFFTLFYREQRRHFSILMTKSGTPVGGALSFDPENRKKIPLSHPIPPLPRQNQCSSVSKAITWASQFTDHPGTLDEFFYPVNFEQAEAWLEQFLEIRLAEFGTYQDALSAEQSILFHSLLSPLLNVGLLTPEQVIEKTVPYAQKHPVPLNSLEGFIRQIIGWREYVYGIYRYHGTMQQESNFFKHAHALPRSFWTGSTEIVPLDNVIKRVLHNAYAHHIERLMVLGNFMLLCEINPNDVYRWFMELFIDAYDWVMIPNIYGMSQYADGGLMTTKPYIAGGNYLRKMSTYPPGIWEKIYTDLYWRFVALNNAKLANVPRMHAAVSSLQNSNPSKLKGHRDDAEIFLKHMRTNL